MSNYSVDFINRLMNQAGRAGEEEAAGFQGALNTLTSLADSTAVDMPEAPTPAANPFGSLGMGLGMAVTGQASQYAAGLTQALQREAARQDQYRAEKLQALNYAKLRETNIGLAKAGIKAEQAKARSSARDKVFDNVRADAKFERTASQTDRQISQTDRQLSQADKRLAQQGAGLEDTFRERYGEYVAKLHDKNDIDTVTRYGRMKSFADILSSDQVSVPVEGEAGGEPKTVLKGRKDMTAEEFAAAQTDMVAQLERDMAHLKRLGGDEDVVDAFYSDFEGIIKGIGETEEQRVKDLAPTKRQQDQAEIVASESRPAIPAAGKNTSELLEVDLFNRLIYGGEGTEDLMAQWEADFADEPAKVEFETRRMLENEAAVLQVRDGLSSGGQGWLRSKGAGQFKGAVKANVKGVIEDYDQKLISNQMRPGKYLRPVRARMLDLIGVEESQLNVNLLEDLNRQIIRAWIDRWRVYNPQLKGPKF